MVLYEGTKHPEGWHRYIKASAKGGRSLGGCKLTESAIPYHSIYAAGPLQIFVVDYNYFSIL